MNPFEHKICIPNCFTEPLLENECLNKKVLQNTFALSKDS